jgi:hypothetical protein
MPTLGRIARTNSTGSMTTQPDGEAALNNGGGGGGAAKPGSLPPTTASHPAEKHKVVYALDYDDCLATAVIFDHQNSRFNIDENHPLIIELRQAQRYCELHNLDLEIISFSNRQSRELDQYNAGRKNNGLAEAALPFLVEWLNNPNNSGHATVSYNEFLLSNLEGMVSPQTWTNKTDLLLYIAHQYPHGTTIHYFDDLCPWSEEDLMKLVKDHPELTHYLNLETTEKRSNGETGYLKDRYCHFNNASLDFMSCLHILLNDHKTLIPNGTTIVLRPFQQFKFGILEETAHGKKNEFKALQTALKEHSNLHQLGVSLDPIMGTGQRVPLSELTSALARAAAPISEEARPANKLNNLNTPDIRTHVAAPLLALEAVEQAKQVIGAGFVKQMSDHYVKGIELGISKDYHEAFFVQARIECDKRLADFEAGNAHLEGSQEYQELMRLKETIIEKDLQKTCLRLRKSTMLIDQAKACDAGDSDIESLGESKKFYFLSLDFDGCAASMFTHTPSSDSRLPETYTIDTTHPIYKHIQSLRAKGHSVVLLIGSNRQSDNLDLNYGHGRCMDAYKALTTQLNHDQKLPPVSFNTYRLSNDNEICWESKANLVVAQLHLIAKIHKIKSQDSVTYELIDDSAKPDPIEIQDYFELIGMMGEMNEFITKTLGRNDLMSSLNTLFTQCPEIIPAGLIVKLTPLLSYSGKEASSLCISVSEKVGTGEALDRSVIRPVFANLAERPTETKQWHGNNTFNLAKNLNEADCKIIAEHIHARLEVRHASRHVLRKDETFTPKKQSLFFEYANKAYERRTEKLEVLKRIVDNDPHTLDKKARKATDSALKKIQNKLGALSKEMSRTDPSSTIVARRLGKSNYLLNTAAQKFSQCRLSAAPNHHSGGGSKANDGANASRTPRR